MNAQKYIENEIKSLQVVLLDMVRVHTKKISCDCMLTFYQVYI